MDTATRFIAAFNDIEAHFRSALGYDEHADFGKLAREYATKMRLPREQQDALLAYAYLRNAISHSRYYGGRPIAQPVEGVVLEIETLCDRILRPPKALTILGSMQVQTATIDESITVVLDHVQRYDYSQFPVYDKSSYAGLLTTNAIARWLAAQMTKLGGMADQERVEKVLAYAEPHEQAVFVDREVTAAQAIDKLARGGPNGIPAAALIVTTNGRKAEKPLAVIVAEDLPKLSGATAFR